MSEVPLYRHVGGLSGVKIVESSLDTTSSSGEPRSKETPTPQGSPYRGTSAIRSLRLEGRSVDVFLF